MKQNILVIEDDYLFLNKLYKLLSNNNYNVISVSNCMEACKSLYDNQIDFLFISLYVSGIDVFNVIEQIRKSLQFKKLPIIVLTEAKDKADCIKALDLGADDFIEKPFDDNELLSRIKAISRRSGNIHNEIKDTLKYKNYKLSIQNRSLIKDDKEISLTNREFEILLTLLENPGRVYSRDQLLNKIWGEHYYGETRIVDYHISSLRKKLSSDNNSIIETVRGVGYKICKTNQEIT